MDNCCSGCPDRRVGCHNAATCAKWAAHEAEKDARYRQNASRDYYCSAGMMRAVKQKVRRIQGGRLP